MRSIVRRVKRSEALGIRAGVGVAYSAVPAANDGKSQSWPVFRDWISPFEQRRRFVAAAQRAIDLLPDQGLWIGSIGFGNRY
jgi:hypothetical protein